MRTTPWNDREEARLRAHFAGLEQHDLFQSCDFARVDVRDEASDDGVHRTIVSMERAQATVTLEQQPDQPLACLARAPGAIGKNGGPPAQPGGALLADDQGRLFVVDVARQRVIMI